MRGSGVAELETEALEMIHARDQSQAANPRQGCAAHLPMRITASAKSSPGTARLSLLNSCEACTHQQAVSEYSVGHLPAAGVLCRGQLSLIACSSEQQTTSWYDLSSSAFMIMHPTRQFSENQAAHPGASPCWGSRTSTNAPAQHPTQMFCPHQVKA